MKDALLRGAGFCKPEATWVSVDEEVFAWGPDFAESWKARPFVHLDGMMSPLRASVIFGTLAACTGLLVSSLVQQMAPGRRHRISPRFLPLGIMVALALVIAVLFHFQPELNFWARDWACLKTGIPLGAIAAVPFWLVLRRGAILSPAMTGAATGLLAGMVGTSALEIHCPNLHAGHILVSHLGVAVLGAAVGLITGMIVGARNTRAIRSSIQHAREGS
jgi:hypothetical protein